MITVQGLVKHYGAKKAVNGISFTAQKGELIGFLGPNGAGKSTVMNIICGYLSPTAGTVTVGGFDTLDDPIEAKKRIGYLPEHPPLYMDMTVAAYLDFVYELRRVDPKALPKKEHIGAALALVGIADVAHRRVGNLSKGYKQRVGLAGALLGDPEVLILDEPTVGLDPMQIIEIREAICALKGKRTILLSSHILSEVQAICDRVLVIDKGLIVADDSPKSLSDKLTGGESVLVTAEGKPEQIKRLLRSLPGVLSVEQRPAAAPEGTTFAVTAKKGCDLKKQVFTCLSDHQMPLLLMQPLELSLEEVFIALTGKEGAK